MSKLSPRRQRFVNAFMGEAAGNATKAAVLAGYSEATARQIGSRLLTYDDVKTALGRQLQKAQMSADESLERLAIIARAEATNPKPIEIIKANELLLKVHGKLQDKSSADSNRVVVNIGFLSSGAPPTVTIDTSTVVEGLVMSRAAPVLIASDTLK